MVTLTTALCLRSNQIGTVNSRPCRAQIKQKPVRTSLLHRQVLMLQQKQRPAAVALAQLYVNEGEQRLLVIRLKPNCLGCIVISLQVTPPTFTSACTCYTELVASPHVNL